MSKFGRSSLPYIFWKRLTSRGYAPSPMWGYFPAQEDLMEQARALFRAEEARDLKSLVAGKIDDIRYFDVAGMKSAVAICMYGSSGTKLLASYLDGHDDVIALPTDRSTRIYQFFERYQSLALHDKLIAYPVFANFFQGDFPIAAADYYAAVKALSEMYGDWSPELLESRRAFFQFIHIVYCVALGRRPASPHPLIVYAQHFVDDQLARRFCEDFPQAHFIHMVRDPITNCGRLFDFWYTAKPWGADRNFLTAGRVLSHLTRADIPHSGMESCTRTIRFEDLHSHQEKTIRAVADWLGLAYRPSLLDSSFNGVPWVVKRETTSWSGPRQAQSIRDLKNLSFTDRAILFAVLNEDFVAWNYPCPDIFKYALVRVFTFMVVLLIPMKMEIISVCNLIKAHPLLRHGGFRQTIHELGQSLLCRIAIMSLLAVELYRRLAYGRKVLNVQ
jgi:hypothetical protein